MTFCFAISTKRFTFAWKIKQNTYNMKVLGGHFTTNQQQRQQQQNPNQNQALGACCGIPPAGWTH